MGKENLIPLNQRTPEEALKIQRAGGIARGKQETAEKEFRQILKAVLKDKSEVEGVDKKTLVNIRLIDKALKGDTKAYEILAAMIGEKPIDEVKNTVVYDTTPVEELINSIEELKNEDNTEVS